MKDQASSGPGRPFRRWVDGVFVDPARGDCETVRSGDRFGRIFGQSMVAIWLVFLLEPLSVGWDLRTEPRGWAGMLAVVAFAVAYLWHFHCSGRIAFAPDEPMSAAQRHLVLPRYLVLLGLAVCSTVLLGQAGTTTWVFLAVSGLWTWKVWRAILASLIMAGLYIAFEYVLPGWAPDNSLLFALLLAMVASSGGMVASRRGRALGRAQQENARLLVEEERGRMARDLHDILGHSLTVITVKAELANRLMDSDQERARRELEDLERLSRGALADVRRAVEGFREISLSGELVRAREALAAAGVQAELPHALDEVPDDLQEVFAWTVREGVTNVVRHSGASRCTVEVDGTSIAIRDDGHAQPVGLSGNGLRGLRERAAAVGAQLVTRTLEPHGFELRMVDAAQHDAESALPVTPRHTTPAPSGEVLA